MITCCAWFPRRYNSVGRSPRRYEVQLCRSRGSAEVVMRYGAAIMLASILFVCLGDATAATDSVPPGGCKPVSERKSEVGCWVIADHEIGELKNAQTFWHLDTFPTR